MPSYVRAGIRKCARIRALSPRARMHDTGDYLYIHYGDLYKGFDLRIDVESPSKPIPFILRGEKVKESQCLKDQDIVYVLTSETVDDLGHAYLFNNPQNKLAVSVLRRLLSVLNAEILLYLPISTTL